MVFMSIDRDSDVSAQEAKEYRSTRLVCAKLYQGGLFTSYEILNSIKRSPFKSKSPEFELDLDLITKHARTAYRYHLVLALTAILLSFLGFISYNNTILSCIFSIPAICILLLKPVYDKYIALNNFSRKSFNPNYNLSNTIQDNNTKSDNNIGQNVIVFGGYSPFLGAGHKLKSRNFIIDLSRSQKNQADEQNNSDTLSVEDLYTAVNREIKNKELPNVSLNYLLFADGKEIDKIDFLLPTKLGAPVENLDFGTLFSKGHKEIFKDYRAYINIRYHDKIRSTLLSTFLRFSEVGTEIFTEYSFYFLPPVDENIFDIDKVPINKIVFDFKVGLLTLFSIGAYITLVPYIIPSVVLFAIAVSPILKLLRYKFDEIDIKLFFERKIRRGERHNYGLDKTFRENIADTNYKNYFNSQDVMMMQGSIEKSILNSIADLLDAKGLDSSFLRKNMIPQVNQNIMMFNGDINAEQVAIGEGSQASGQRVENFQQQIFTSSKETQT